MYLNNAVGPFSVRSKRFSLNGGLGKIISFFFVILIQSFYNHFNHFSRNVRAALCYDAKFEILSVMIMTLTGKMTSKIDTLKFRKSN